MNTANQVTLDPASRLNVHHPRRCSRTCSLAVLCLSIACVLFSVWAVSIGWNNTIFDAHGFRQSQTAITVYYTKWGSEFLRYETPVLGPPWSIPFEFPLFQAIVAAVWHILPLQLDQAGRLTSIALFYFTLLPLFTLLCELKLSKLTALVTIALLAVSPQYIFWSRTFMIESTAMCLAVVYLMFTVLTLNNAGTEGKKAWIFGGLSAFAGALAGVVKVTTYAPFFLGALLLIGCTIWKQWDRFRSRVTLMILLPVCALLIPVVCVAVWTSYADSVKNVSTITQFLTSPLLGGWNFGTLQQRVEFASYTHFAGIGIGHVVDDLIGNRYLLLISCVVGVAVGGYRLRVMLTCLALYASAIAIFFNLHFQHTYYAYANGIFLITLLGAAVGSLLDAGSWKSWVGVCLFSVAIGSCVAHYLDGYYRVQRANAPGRSATAAIIDGATTPNDVLLIYGLDWSPELPYQAHRRAIMIREYQRDASLRQAVREEGAGQISSLLICDEGLKPTSEVLAALSEYGVTFTRRFDSEGCRTYLR